MGFNEGRFLANIDRRRRVEKVEQERRLRDSIGLPPTITKLHERFKKEMFSSREYTVQAPELIPVYGEEAVERDMREVFELRKKMEASETPDSKRAKILAETFEGIVLYNARHNKWFGDAIFYKTSLYDDYKNKTDMFGEWYSPKEGSRVLALAVDLTFSQQQGVKKLEQIQREIEQGELGKIRYFKDARGDYKGTRFNVPRVVLGVGSRELADVAALTLTRKSERLEHHPVRDTLIREMHTQLTSMEHYAQKVSQPDAARAYQQALSAVEPLFAQSAKNRVDSTDPVLLAIESRMRQL